MDIRIYQDQAAQDAVREVYIFNPTDSEFSITYNQKIYTVVPMGETRLPFHVAELISLQIIDFLINKKGSYVSPEEQKKMEKIVKLYEQNTTTI